MHLTRRLRALLDTIEPCDTLADIGTDHALLAVGAVLENKANRVLAVDISPFCVQKAKNAVSERDLNDRIQCLQSDGLTAIKEKINTAVIAGMGGREIVSILDRAKNHASSVDTYILSPHQDAQILRKYLQKCGYYIEKDFVINDEKFYDIIVTRFDEKRGNNYTNAEIYIGKNLPRTLCFEERMKSRKSRLMSIIAQAGGIERLDKELQFEAEVVLNYVQGE